MYRVKTQKTGFKYEKTFEEFDVAELKDIVENVFDERLIVKYSNPVVLNERCAVTCTIRDRLTDRELTYPAEVICTDPKVHYIQETYEKAFWGAAISFLKVSVEMYDEKPSSKNRKKETLPGDTSITISDDMMLLFGNMRGRTFKDVKDTPQFAHFLEQLCETRNLSFSDEARNEQLNLLLKYAAERMNHEKT